MSTLFYPPAVFDAQLQLNLNSSNTDGSFTLAYFGSCLSPYEILAIAHDYKC